MTFTNRIKRLLWPFYVPFIVTWMGVFGIAYFLLGMAKHDTSGDLEVPATLGLVALLCALILGTLLGGVVTLVTGAAPFITVPSAYYLTILAGYLLPSTKSNCIPWRD